MLFGGTAEAAEQDLGEIVVKKQVPRGSSREDYSAFVTVIDPKEYGHELKSTAELLEQSVGVRIIDLGGLGQEQSVSIRGSSSEQVVVMLDGVRLNTAQRGGIDIASIPLEIVERIEVMRGGEAANYGTDAVGGVVNIITKKGVAGGDNKPQSSILGTFGSFTTAKGAITHGWKIGDFDYFLSHTHLSSEGDFPFRDQNFQNRVRINNETISEAPYLRLGYDVPDIGRFELSEQFYWANRGQPGFGSSQQAFSDSTDLRSLTSLRYERRKFLFDPLDLKITSYYRHDDFEFSDPQPRLGPPILSDTASRAYGGDLRLDAALPYQMLSFITELRNDEAKVFSTAVAGLAPQNIQSERFTYALVVKDEIQLLDDQLSLLPSLRFEDSNRFGAEWIPKFGARVRPQKWLVFKGNISRVFRTPNFDELYFPESGFVGGNPNLVPESGFSGDVGFEIQQKPVFFSVTAFYSDMERAIFFVPVSATRIEPINFTDDAISQGFEVVADIEPSIYFSAHLNYTYLDHFFESTKYILPGRANHDANLRLVGKLPPWVKVYVEGEYLSEFSVVLAASGGQLEPERFVMNTGFSVTPVDWLALSFDAKNVNDEQGLNDARDVPLPERSFYGSAEVKF